MSSKTVSLFVSAAVIAVISTTARAIPRAGESMPMNYAVMSQDLSAWHIGAYYRTHDITMEQSDVGFEQDLTVDHAAFMVGHDILPWMQGYGIIGVADGKIDNFMEDESKGAVEVGAGVLFNLIDHDMFDYLATVTRYNVQGGLQISYFDSTGFDWTEINGHVTLGLTHELTVNKFLWPDTLSLFVGPVFDYIVSDEYEQDGDDVIGLMFGLDVQINKYIGMSVSSESYESGTALNASVSARF